MLKTTPNLTLLTLVKIKGGWARSLYQFLKLYLRPNRQNTFGGHPLCGCWAQFIDKKKERKEVLGLKHGWLKWGGLNIAEDVESSNGTITVVSCVVCVMCVCVEQHLPRSGAHQRAWPRSSSSLTCTRRRHCTQGCWSWPRQAASFALQSRERTLLTHQRR